jgi:hypothetical protein
MATDYPFHKGARSAYNVTGVLCCLLVVGIPLGIWIFMRAAAARVTLTGTGLEAKGVFSTRKIEFADIDRLGMLKVPITAPGIGGALARQKVGGGDGIHLVARTKDGTNWNFLASMYEGMDDIFNAVSSATGKPVEPVTAGLMGVSSTKWT